MHSTAQHSTAQHSTVNDIGESYNELPYPSLVFAHCQPTRLHAIAKLKGLNPPDVRNAKILEIGCSFGGNLLPFAIQFPNSRIIGIDLSEHQIEVGKKMMAEIGIENIQLLAGDISQIDFGNSQFDYIICHGVFSWVPESVQNAILSCVQRYLSPNGIAYISYNTYPGWHYKERIRNLILFDAKNKAKQDKLPLAKELLKYSEKILERRGADDLSLFKKECEVIFGENQSYVYHEYLEKFNQPFYFSEFLDKIKQHQLGYVTDGEMIDIMQSGFTNQEYSDICVYYQNNLEQIEQYTDFILNRAFRMSLISHTHNSVHLDNMYNEEVINEIYFYGKLIKAEFDNEPAPWIGNSFILSTPITDKICQKINDNQGQIQFKSLLSQLKVDYPEEDVIPRLMFVLLGAYFSFYSNPLKGYTEKPCIFEKYRNLIRFTYHNPNITRLTDCYYGVISLEYFAVYLSHYLDGKNSIDDLVQIVNNAIKSGEFSWQMELSPDVNKEQVIRNDIINTLNKFVEYGFFNHYE